MRFLRTFVVGLLFLGFTTVAMAEVKLPSIIGSNMILQRNEEVPVWGWSEPGTKVQVQFDGKTATATAGKDGRWQAMLGPLAVGEPRTMVITSDKGDKVQLDNVLVGEVWVCSGQSNMQWNMVRDFNATEAIAKAKYPKLRLFMVPLVTSTEPVNDFKGLKPLYLVGTESQWMECTPENVKEFSAIAYYFGRKLMKDLDVPVGVIRSAWGGTCVEPWIPTEDIQKIEAAEPLLQWWKERIKKKPEMANDKQRPANLYNAMIYPLLPYGIRGVIWYQGESNMHRAVQYESLFPGMINAWRRVWNKPDMPFGFVQLAPFRYLTARFVDAKGKETKLCELWEAQLKTLKNTPNTGMVVTTDITDLMDIHPPKKEPVGDRLATWAEATVYGKKDLVYSGPIYKSMKVEGDKIRLTFDHVGGGLKISDENSLTCFTIAGEDEKFLPAMAKIEGDTVVVSSRFVKKPVAARFGWHEASTPNLINAEGLPASPFRTDDFKSITEGAMTP